jgi:hypothetical protein
MNSLDFIGKINPKITLFPELFSLRRIFESKETGF